jgi:hypothetical protein
MEKYFLLPMLKLEVKTQNGGSYLYIYTSELKEYTWS